VDLGKPGLERQRFFIVSNGFPQFALFLQCAGEIALSLGPVRRHRDDLSVNTLSLFKLPGILEADGQSNEFLDLGE
jgi:hypothetical protein